MRAALKSLDLAPDPAMLPGDAAEFSLRARMVVGPRDGLGKESFDVTVCTREWLAQAASGGFYDARPHVVVNFGAREELLDARQQGVAFGTIHLGYLHAARSNDLDVRALHEPSSLLDVQGPPRFRHAVPSASTHSRSLTGRGHMWTPGSGSSGLSLPRALMTALSLSAASARSPG